MPLEISENQSLLETAWYISAQHQRTFYDSLYLALAQIENCRFVTADQAFVNALKTTELSSLLLYIEEVR